MLEVIDYSWRYSMKTIFILNASPRKNGTTSKILTSYEKILSSFPDIKVHLVHISDLQLLPCIGCCVCYKQGSCHLNDTGDLISTEIENADALIIGTPTYVSNVSGQLKTFIDRGHVVMEQLLKDKPCGIVVTGENYGKQDVIHILRKLILYAGGYSIFTFSINVPFQNNPQLSEKMNRRIKKQALLLRNEIQSPSYHLIKQIHHAVIFNIGIKRFVFQKQEAYAGVIEKWKQKGILK